jgi:hypothetical protein
VWRAALSSCGNFNRAIMNAELLDRLTELEGRIAELRGYL